MSAALTELEAMLTADQRRTVSVDQHAAWLESLNPKQPDEIEEFIRAVEPNRGGSKP